MEEAPCHKLIALFTLHKLLTLPTLLLPLTLLTLSKQLWSKKETRPIMVMFLYGFRAQCWLDRC